MNRTSSRRRIEADREDLMRDATALRERAEYRIRGEPQSVVAGYRPDGSLSVYFGPDPCFHFDSACRLRRAFQDGDLLRTQGTTLARLRRVRVSDSVQLRRYDLSAAECAQFWDAARSRLRTLAEALSSGTAQCLGEIPGGSSLAARLCADLARLVQEPLRLAPTIAGKH